MVHRLGRSNNVLIQSLKKNTQEQKNPTKHKQLALSLRPPKTALTKVLKNTNRRPWIKLIPENFHTTVRVRKTGKITSIVAFRWRLLLSNERSIIRDGDIKMNASSWARNSTHPATRQRQAAEPVSHGTEKTRLKEVPVSNLCSYIIK